MYDANIFAYFQDKVIKGRNKMVRWIIAKIIKGRDKMGFSNFQIEVKNISGTHART